MIAAPKLRETMWAEQRPDCYGGGSCDQVEPQWRCYADGDMDADHTKEPLILDAKTFPPGTKVTVSEPVCPERSSLREVVFPTPDSGPQFKSKCGCGFDWRAWVLDQYS